MISKKFKIFYFTLNTVLILAIMLMDVFTCFVFHNVVFKNIAAILSCILAISNLIVGIIIYKKWKLAPNIFVCLGVIIGAVADTVINKNAIAGAVLFAIGHIFYLIALHIISKFKLKELFFFILVFMISVVLIFVPNVDLGNLTFPIILYAIILSAMFAKCVNNYAFNSKKSSLYAVMAIAGFLFYLSDLLLMFYYFKGGSALLDQLCLLAYYPAQIMFAVSILFPLRRIKKPKKNQNEDGFVHLENV